MNTEPSASLCILLCFTEVEGSPFLRDQRQYGHGSEPSSWVRLPQQKQRAKSHRNVAVFAEASANRQ